MTGKVLWNDGWKFGKLKYAEEELNKEPAAWNDVVLPHDWLIYNIHDLYENSIGWYKKEFEYHNDGLLSIIRFEGVYMDATIYVNDKEIGCWKYGYSTFDFDLTNYLLEGRNTIKVRVVHIAPNSRWYSGAGIYRNVWLLKKPASHIVLDGVYITPIQLNEDWRVEIDTEVFVGALSIHHIRQSIFDMSGKLINSQEELVDLSATEQQKVKVFHQALVVHNPALWDIGQGNLYILRTELCSYSGVLDISEEKFGFRTIRMDAQQGFFLNGRHVKIKGSCEHHGFGCLGAVANKAAIRRKLIILRSMGVNAIRTAHNMPSTEFMELADEMGILVDSEAFDIWSKRKTTYDYARFFEDWYKKDVASWIRRDRNHPSIIMWSVGNEIYDIHAGEQGMQELQMLIHEVRLHDNKQHAKITFASNYMRWENAQKCAELVDAVGYNYGEYLYEEHHEKHPEWVIYGSETSSMLASRNVYHFPLNKDILCEDDEQCSALGNCFAGWGAHNYLDNIIADRDAAYSLGQFIWSGMDYFGEATPYNTRNCYFGQIDTAGFPKDSYFIYQAEWTDYKVSPMIHIFPYWDFNIGQLIDVCVCSNAPMVELFLNGKSLGCQEIDHVNGKELIPHWSILYEPGELLAIAYDEHHQAIAKDCRHSFGNVAELRITMDERARSGNAEELVFMEISAYDSDGYPVENANNRVQIEVAGAGRLIGLDNGDSTDFDQVKGTSKRLFGGKLLAVIEPRTDTNELIYIKAAACGVQQPGLSISPDEEGYEVPIRKIELICEEPLILTKEHPCLHVKYKVEPPNATYDDILFKIVDDIGIEVSIASLEIKQDEVILSAKGDGVFQLRCIAMNGGTVASVRSSLQITITGFGAYLMNPYQCFSTGLCKERSDSLSEGVGHGIRFLGKKEAYISFQNLDFGTYGTEEITMELFKYTEGSIHFQVFVEEDNEKIRVLDGSFDKAAGWLEFHKQTYRLEERICGVRKIGIASTDNFQLKSLVFTPFAHGLEKIYAKNFDEIFGDSYQIEEDAVRNIGNNVTLAYHNMNFGGKPVTKLVICGRSDLEINSIHLKVVTAENSTYELLEFEKSENYLEREYDIAPITEDAEIRFVFLPGSQFDFAWFMFR